MARHVIVGAGPVGTAAAWALLGQGHQVRMITRRGRGPEHPAIGRIAADATDAARLAELTTGAAALYNCANPSSYRHWEHQWPPLAAALLAAAERTGAALITMSNLYGYGPTAGPMTHDTPLAPTTRKGRIRARMWEELRAAHEQGRVVVAEARASDFTGADSKSLFATEFAARIDRGSRIALPISYDVPHSLTYVEDAGRTMAVLGTDERAWGRAWHVPTPPATTLREAAQRYAELAGRPLPALVRLPAAALWAVGLVQRDIREFAEMRYQFVRPFVLDSSLTEQTFGLTPTSLDDALRSMIRGEEVVAPWGAVAP